MRWLVFICALVATGAGYAQTPGEAIESALQLNSRALAAQQRIDRLATERKNLLNEIDIIEQAGSAYALRNRELEQQISALQQNLVEIDADLRAVSETETGIIATLDAMIDALEQFITLDLPFRTEARLEKIAGLRSELLRADLDVTDKYQAVVSAYLDEIRFGYTHSVIQQRIDTANGVRTVNILRLGRAGLWYVTPDGDHAGRWDPRQSQWIDADTDRQAVLDGIAMVRDSAKPVVVSLPVQLNLSP